MILGPRTPPVALSSNAQMYIFSQFKNSVTLTRINIFSFRQKFLVAAIPLYNRKQQKVKIDLGHSAIIMKLSKIILQDDKIMLSSNNI